MHLKQKIKKYHHSKHNYASYQLYKARLCLLFAIQCIFLTGFG